MLTQVSIYTENKKGTMQNISEILENAGINILGSVTNDSAEYGIVRMVVSEPEKAVEVFEAAGYLCKMTDILGIEMEDQVGALNHLLSALKESNINVNYMYLSFNRKSGKPILIVHTGDITEVEECLKTKGFVSV